MRPIQGEWAKSPRDLEKIPVGRGERAGARRRKERREEVGVNPITPFGLTFLQTSKGGNRGGFSLTTCEGLLGIGQGLLRGENLLLSSREREQCERGGTCI